MSMTIQSSVKDKILATPSETSKVENVPAEMLRDLDQQMEKRANDGCILWIKLYSKYEYEIRYHPGKANVVIDALRRKERMKPRRVRAIAMTIQYGVRGMILAPQGEAFKQENVLAESLHGQKEHTIQTLEDIMRPCVIDFGGSYQLSIRCAPFEALYGRKCRSPVLWAESRESSLIGPVWGNSIQFIFEESEEEKVQETEFGVPSGEKVNKSEDPFGIYSLLQKNKTNMENKVNEEDHSLSHPPGFTPEVDQFEGNAMGDIAEKVYTEKENDVNSFVNKDIGNNDSNSVNNNVEPTDLDRSKLLRSGGSILNFMEEVVKVGQTMGYNMEGCIKDINDIIESQGEFGETKMGTMDLNTVRSCWGNSIFEYVQSDSVGYSGGILCIWDPNSFRRNSFTRSDYFVIIRGVWLKSGIDLLIVVVYAPQDAKEKHMLWEYLTHISNSWDGKIVMMGDFNEVRFKSDRFGSNFNVHEAEKFNSFIYNAGMEEVSLGGSAFTWCHRSASKMSKLDRFFVSENLLTSCPNISAITLERFISDHRPILLRETSFDYGPIPFRFYKYWLEVDGFDKMVRESWEAAPGNKDNAIRSFMGKLKFLKDRIRVWLSIHKANSRSDTDILKEELRLCDELIDKGMGSSEVVQNRLEILNKIHQVQKNQASEISQKAKIKWAIEGDENVKFFHGILNKKRSQSQIRGVMANGVWIDDPVKVKDEFLMHFRSRFDKPLLNRALLDLNFTNSL
ncbi:RNA-directed DNA polymerase, eukaryota, partial [Tanacetum coccineum]